ncbi:hypothetical protein ACFOWX_09225 [Sphingorhabdus arenilitoris]|uniref:Helix-turn-helix domain-containing protein n=1 Tax=Sphingorhabdus arenilitoris TaxID=1490041 RepID=A0ABV8RJY0_9SPHN
MSGGPDKAAAKAGADAVAAVDTNALMPNPLMPGLRIRQDGWTPARTRLFLAVLGQSGCIRDAARVAGISKSAAYRAKERFPLFSDAWDKAMAGAQRGLQAIAWQRAVEGKETVIIRKGEEVERRITPDSSILALLLKQGRLTKEDEAEQISYAEWEQGYRFDGWGRKYKGMSGEETKAALLAKLAQMRERMNGP